MWWEKMPNCLKSYAPSQNQRQLNSFMNQNTTVSWILLSNDSLALAKIKRTQISLTSIFSK